ncbi:MAG TPA: BlaI/MecI/CopY family transcriptional regulator [Firmicutes bacterium]|nr:BlaI/MecI/CopY family transcriptional regulator [Candidatus Fermentithermobacillaceae bacterium]
MPREKEISIPNSEWMIMELLWDEAPLTVTQIARAMEEKTGWTKSTTKTLINRMAAKGLLRLQEGEKAREYYPAIPRSEAVLAETESLLARLYNGSLGLMVHTLVDQKSLSRREIEELRAILDKMEGVE